MRPNESDPYASLGDDRSIAVQIPRVGDVLANHSGLQRRSGWDQSSESVIGLLEKRCNIRDQRLPISNMANLKAESVPGILSDEVCRPRPARPVFR